MKGAKDRTSALVGIVGDFDSEHLPLRATNDVLGYTDLRFEWVPTDEVAPPQAAQKRLDAYAGLVIAPAPIRYRSRDGALAAIRFAREHGVPLVAT